MQVIRIENNNFNLTQLLSKYVEDNNLSSKSLFHTFTMYTEELKKDFSEIISPMISIKRLEEEEIQKQKSELGDYIIETLGMDVDANLVGDTQESFENLKEKYQLVTLQHESLPNEFKIKENLNNLAMYVSYESRAIYGNVCILKQSVELSGSDVEYKLMNFEAMDLYRLLFDSFVKTGILITPEQNLHKVLYSLDEDMKKLCYDNDGTETNLDLDEYNVIRMNKNGFELLLYVEKNYHDKSINYMASKIVGDKKVHGNVFIKNLTDAGMFESIESDVVIKLATVVSSDKHDGDNKYKRLIQGKKMEISNQTMDDFPCLHEFLSNM